MVYLLFHVFHAAARHIHLASEDRLEWLLTLFLQVLVDFVTLVEKVFHAKHIAVVSNGHAAHSVADGFLYQGLDRALTIKQRIICMRVQVNKVVHSDAKLQKVRNFEKLSIVKVGKNAQNMPQKEKS